MNPHVSIGPITIYYYGLILGIAVIAAYFFARARCKRYGINADIVDSVVLWAVPLGIIGARLYYLLFSWEQFKDEPLSALFIWQGGLAIHGALLGGAVGVWLGWIFARRRQKNIHLATMMDVLAPTLFLGQIIGRLANFVNQEAYGAPTTLPWGIYIRPERRLPGLEGSERFHPTFAYEALWNLIGLGLLLWFEQKMSARVKPQKSAKGMSGLVFALYIAWYSLGRLWIEALRTDALMVGPMRITQIVSVVGIIAGSSLIWYRLAQWRHQAPSA